MTGLLIDSNLLCLFVVGLRGTDRIGRHSRLRVFGASDWNNLAELVGVFGPLVFLPHVLTETCNLLKGSPGQIDWAVLGDQVLECAEIRPPAQEIVLDPQYLRLGLTDTALLRHAQRQRPLISVDGPLCYAAAALGVPHINYNHFRDGSITIADIQDALG